MVKAADRAENPARSSVWLEERTPRAGGGPAGLDRDRIVAAAIRMLDEEGLAGLSMRKLATELGVTAMSLYWYVDTKDDIVEFALDAVYREVDLGAVEAAETWQDRIRVLALVYRGMLVRHPWLSPCVGSYLNIGPNALAVGYRIQQAVRDSGLPLHGVPGAMAAVFQFVYGYGTIEGQFGARAAAAGMSQEDFYREALTAFRDDPEFSPKVEDMKDILDERASHGSVSDIWERDFAFALDVLVSGIEAMVARERERTGNGNEPGTGTSRRRE
ncbi:TetR/AcrR family transcriptional regulator C-terminal domain-containing protein [Streptomyces sp. NPDC057235]|uniref:TetR/AcrR family transcriptional regulator C-terminal domain-containing protein n=1 Tax=Streptomyces sp. NPDC057235 TaxID=3346058 RepID=UPI00362C0C95